MKKIPTLFVRDTDDRRYVTPEVTPGCEWVLAGEGVATRKYDGTCVMFDGSRWWARREVKPGKTPPPDFDPISTDPNTGKTMGWEPIEQSGFAKFADEVLQRHTGDVWMPGTYELCGPKVNGNPEGYERHTLILHAAANRLDAVPRDYDGLRDYLSDFLAEGIVWHHPDGRMVKLKRRDFPRDTSTTPTRPPTEGAA